MELSREAIQVTGLHFMYPNEDRRVLENLNLSVKEGARFGLFGPNGAGKTTLMSCISGILEAEKGSISVFGHRIPEDPAKTQIGVVPQDFAFYHELNTIENLQFFGSMYGLNTNTIMERSRQLIEVLNLSEVASKPLEQLSGGYKRRVNLAIGVLHRPRLLILDEPTVGVDVQTRREIIQFLKQLNNEGTTVFYTSHQLNEAEELCDEVALMHRGRIIAQNKLDLLLAENASKDLEELFIRRTLESENK